MDSRKKSGPTGRALETRHLYTLHDEIAWGGMAAVRLAQQTGPHGLSKIVAIKTLLAQSAPDSEFVSMFHDEIRMASRVNHPNVVPVLDVVATDSELLLVMEYVHGESVARLLKRYRAAIPARIATTIMAGILRGLHAAHLARSEGGEPLHIVHRDVTPHNMVVGVDGTPRLLDFGIAHAVGRMHATRSGHVKGKLAYMAPEQLLNTAVDRRVDIYSAAATLWEMLAGRRLFEGHKDKMVQMILHQTPQPPGALQRGLPPRLDAIVLRGLHRDPQQRYATARDMAIALEQETETVSATELGDWVSRTWGDAREQREQLIRSIENNTPPSGERDRTPLLTGAGASRRLFSSESVTRALDAAAPALPNAPEPEVPTRPDLPPALFALPPPTPVVALTPGPQPAQRTADLKRGAPLVLAVAACLLLAAHLWLGDGGRRDMVPPPLATPAGAPLIPNIEPLSPTMALHPDSPSARAPVDGGLANAPPTSGLSAKQQEQALSLDPPVATREDGVAPGSIDDRGPARPAVQTPEAQPPPSPGRARPEENNPRQRPRVRRAPVRATAIASVGPSIPVPGAASPSRGGPAVTPPASGADRPAVDCVPPFVVDSRGIKHFKLACL